ncbi:sigma-54-dependent Fis family transcriptional regulator [Belnapia sp. T6]|uniref:Sigma-54-dependent Fis family transcriptional regulator n=1 Tax=Belnapia mucosa TaxID=2804532 RepID=A0ABS1V440_9PROT|nr:sigma-54 dependent transcriptional regulator [Belnapia mucosa]MBL6456459.1 sigma-54-dependent Fis family transcriptional regulator [Belnapia mucosa]
MSGATGRVLLVEDTPTQAEVAKAHLRDLGHEIRAVETATEALEVARSWDPDAILLDLELPDFSGLEVLKTLRAEGSETAVIVITANASMNTAVEVMRAGATDFLPKPYPKAKLVFTLQNAMEKRALVIEKRALESELQAARALTSRQGFMGFIGASPAMQAVYRTIENVAASRANIFITGESGTGKELAAEAVHKASPRAGKPFVALNCGAIPRDLLESEIFGHVKGAFTGATETRLGAAKQADGGTLFLDEIGEMPLEMQVKLLRFVQTGSFQPVGGSRPEKVDVRFVCATNRDPLAEVEAGRFREDLYYRLYVVPIELPPLRARGQDVLLIARAFLTQFSREERKRFRSFTPEAEGAILAYPWPGNVRQLQNVVRNVVVLHEGERVEAAMLPATLLRAGPRAAPAPAAIPTAIPTALAEPAMPAAEPAPAAWQPPPEPAPAPSAEPAGIEIMPLAEMERRLILAALDQTGQDVPRAASLLEINPSTIYRKLQSWRGAKQRVTA